MKKLFLFLLIFTAVRSSAQQYAAFPTTNAEWNVKYSTYNEFSGHSTDLLKYRLIGDTIIDNKQYSKLYAVIDEATNYNILKGFMREQDKRIYYLEHRNNGYPYIKSLTNQAKNCIRQKLNEIADNGEFILYDFDNKQVGDTLFTYMYFQPAIIEHIDSVLVQNNYRKRYRIPSMHGYDYVIEGIGSVREGLFGAFTSVPTCGYVDWQFISFASANQYIYLNPAFKNYNSTEQWSDIDFLIKNTEWYYEKKSYSSIIPNTTPEISYLKLKSTADTIINNKYCKTISMLSGNAGCFQYHNTVYMYQSNDTAYFYNKTLNKFSILNVYGAQKNDTWNIEYERGNIKVVVDSVSTVNLYGKQLKELFVRYQDFSYDINNPSEYKSKITEGIGDNIYMFKSNIFYLPLCDEFAEYSGLRCYIHTAYGTYHIGTLACDYATTGTNFPSAQSIKVYNSSDNTIRIQLANACQLELLDYSGRVLSTVTINSDDYSYNSTYISKGLYIYRITRNSILLQTGKIIKD